MTTQAEADRLRDNPVDQITDWDAIKARLDEQHRTRPPPIRVGPYPGFLRVVDLTLTFPINVASLACAKICNKALGKIDHIHDAAQKFSLTVEQAQDFVRRTLDTIEAKMKAATSGGASLKGFGVKWSISSEVKTRDEVETRLREQLRVQLAREATFALNDPQDCTDPCGRIVRYFGLALVLSFHGELRVCRSYNYDVATGLLTWLPDFTIVAGPDCRLHAETVLGWLDPKFNWSERLPCEPCSEYSYFDEGTSGSDYLVCLYDAIGPGLSMVDSPPAPPAERVPTAIAASSVEGRPASALADLGEHRLPGGALLLDAAGRKVRVGPSAIALREAAPKLGFRDVIELAKANPALTVNVASLLGVGHPTALRPATATSFGVEASHAPEAAGRASVDQALASLLSGIAQALGQAPGATPTAALVPMASHQDDAITLLPPLVVVSEPGALAAPASADQGDGEHEAQDGGAAEPQSIDGGLPPP